MTSLQDKVKSVFDKLHKYAQTVNLEEVDPQMRNNKALHEMLKQFEDVWIMGTEHLLNAKHRDHLREFSALIEKVCRHYS